MNDKPPRSHLHITIHDERRNKVCANFAVFKKEDLLFDVSVFEGNRVLNLIAQADEVENMAVGSIVKEKYSFYNSFMKFGSMMQDEHSFEVSIKRTT